MNRTRVSSASFFLILVLLLSSCGLVLKDLDVTLPEVPEPGDGVALEDGILVDPSVDDGPPEDLAFVDEEEEFVGEEDGLLESSTGVDTNGPESDEEVASPVPPDNQLPLEVASFDPASHVVTLGAEDVSVAYAAVEVDPGQRVSFTSQGWEPGVAVAVRFRPGLLELGTFVVEDSGQATGVVQIPSEAFGEGRIQFVGRINGTRVTDTVHVSVDGNMGVSPSTEVADQAPIVDASAALEAARAAKAQAEVGLGNTPAANDADNIAVCGALRQVEVINRGITSVLNGETVDTTQDPLVWFPTLQGEVDQIEAAIGLLRTQFLAAADLASPELAPLILGANEDDAFLVDGLTRVYRTSVDIASFDVALRNYRNDPAVQEVETNHRLLAVEEFTVANCDGLTFDSFQG